MSRLQESSDPRPRDPPRSPVLLAAGGVAKSYLRGGRRIHSLSAVDLAARRGEITVIEGPSGSGKSTLGRCLAFLEPVDQGRVTLAGREPAEGDAEALRRMRRKVQLIFQDPARSFNPWQKPLEALREPFAGDPRRAGSLGLLGPLGSDPTIDRRVRELLSQVGLSRDELPSLARDLSGGQAQRLALARALATDPEVLVLDETLTGLDLSLRARMVNLLLHLIQHRGLTCVLITHDPRLAGQLADHRIRLERGRVVDCRDALEPTLGSRQ